MGAVRSCIDPVPGGSAACLVVSRRSEVKRKSRILLEPNLAMGGCGLLMRGCEERAIPMAGFEGG